MRYRLVRMIERMYARSMTYSMHCHKNEVIPWLPFDRFYLANSLVNCPRSLLSVRAKRMSIRNFLHTTPALCLIVIGVLADCTDRS